jgi:hypothetical protein
VTVFYPDAVGTQGKDTWIFVPAIAAKSAPTVAELTATGACVLQNAFRPGFGADSDIERISDERQGALVTYETLGTTKVTLADMILIDRPQDTAATATRKHLDVLSAGATGFLVNRRGLGSAVENWVAPLAGQKVIVYPVQVSPQTPTAPGDTKGFERKVSFAVTGAAAEGIVA